ncbi:esterase-like activity of phytase family protein [Allorhizobium undicola]|uniref:esterase-like activity of phytase family protein n=1 Tax=Allorhizobium undicola TaxID=78527 RepID=UPI0038B29AC9
MLGGLRASAEPLTVTSRQITEFKPGSDHKLFGKLEFLGGISMTSPNSLFGAWSSIRFLPDRRHFIGVLDTGDWISGTIERDQKGKLSGLSGLSIAPMLDAGGRSNAPKWAMDAESLAIRGEKIYVGFEQQHRIDQYPLKDFETAKPERSLKLPFPVAELRGNQSLETLTVSPSSGPLAGGLVTVTEKSLDNDGNLLAGVVDGPASGAFRVARHDGFDVTDGAWLPNGDLLLLERRFRFSTGVAMRILRIAGKAVKPAAGLETSPVDGEVLLEADYSFQIDNMEGLDVIDAGEGDLRLILVSDDNHSILQRSLMLEFRLLP